MSVLLMSLLAMSIAGTVVFVHRLGRSVRRFGGRAKPKATRLTYSEDQFADLRPQEAISYDPYTANDRTRPPG